MSDLHPTPTWSGYDSPEPYPSSSYSSPSPSAPVLKRSPPPLLLSPPTPKRFCLTTTSVKSEPYAHDSDLEDDDAASDYPDDDDDDNHLDRPRGRDKFTKSRAVGQSHRDNEKEHVIALLRDVGFLKDENVLLFALFCHASHNDSALSVSLRRVLQMTSRDRPEDYRLSDAQARARGMHRLPAPTAAILGMKYISTSLAVLVLEFLGVRRNLISSAPDPARPRRRRRGSSRAAPTLDQANHICRYATHLFRDDAARIAVPEPERLAFVDAKMGALAVALHRWSEHEKRNNPPPFDADDDDDFSDPPGSPTRPDAAEFGSPSRRRGEGAKRCSRCNMLKFTGSGHGRSKCDDGYSISSLVPYPASPREDGNASN